VRRKPAKAADISLTDGRLYLGPKALTRCCRHLGIRHVTQGAVREVCDYLLEARRG
jgi:3-deoxy-D-manno-octulosonate 8-phosphate phosphatase KdsC-like HAD superfamily phosphatase